MAEYWGSNWVKLTDGIAGRSEDFGDFDVTDDHVVLVQNTETNTDEGYRQLSSN